MKHTSKPIRVASLAVAPHQFVQVEVKAFPAEPLELPVNRPLHDRPETLDRVGVRHALDVSEQVALGIADAVIDGAVRHELVDATIPTMLICGQDRIATGDHLPHGSLHVFAGKFGFADRLGL
jgi:hypothetical protein